MAIKEVKKFYDLLKTPKIQEFTIEFNNLYKNLLEESITNSFDFENMPEELEKVVEELEKDLKATQEHTFTSLEIFTLLFEDFIHGKKSLEDDYYEKLSFRSNGLAKFQQPDLKNFINSEANVVEVFKVIVEELKKVNGVNKFKEDYNLALPNFEALDKTTLKFKKLLEDEEVMNIFLSRDFTVFKRYWKLLDYYSIVEEDSYYLILNEFFKGDLETKQLRKRLDLLLKSNILDVLEEYIFAKYPLQRTSEVSSKNYSFNLGENFIKINYFHCLKIFGEYDKEGWLLLYKVLQTLSDLIEEKYLVMLNSNLQINKAYEKAPLVFDGGEFLKLYNPNMPIEWNLELLLDFAILE